MTTSAYLSIFDDWELLKPALWSIEDQVDDIVVVDGAYEWMQPYFAASGRDPSRSREEVYDVLSTFGRKVRVLRGTWENESRKREAGYEACRGRYAVRADADEVFFWDSAALGRFLSSGRSVGQMEMPVYVAPGLIRASGEGASVERQSFFFDRDRIDARQHLGYLWLVLPPEEQGRLLAPRREEVFAEPLAFTAHLTHWRPPATAVARARFYVLNYARSTGGIPWLPGFHYEPGGSFAEFFDLISPAEFHDVLLGHPIVACAPDLRDKVLSSSPRTTQEERSFSMLFDVMLAALARQNAELMLRARTLALGQAYHLDASTSASLDALTIDGNLQLAFSHPISVAKLSLSSIYADGRREEDVLEPVLDGMLLSCPLPALEGPSGRPIRRDLSMSVWGPQGRRTIRFRAAFDFNAVAR